MYKVGRLGVLIKMYEDCKVYEYFHKPTGRWRVYLILPDGSRKYMNRARYNYEYFWDIKLDPKTQHVDHIDENPLNDNIKNLQILTPKENTEKRVAKEKPPIQHTFNCPTCGKEKTVPLNGVRLRKQKNFFCSVSCSNKRKG